MLPPIKTKADLDMIIKRHKRWRGRQRILALYHCRRAVKNLRFRNELDAFEVKRYIGKIKTLIVQEERLWTSKGNTLPIKRTSPRRAVAPELEKETPAIMPIFTLPAKKLATERGIDMAAMIGTGKNGKVTKADVQRAIDGNEPVG